MKKFIMFLTTAWCTITILAKEIKTEVVDDIEWSYEGGVKGVEIKGWRPVDTGVERDSVTTLTVPSKLVDGIVYCIDGDAFANCQCLEVVTLPKDLVRINSRAFMGCSRLREINIPNSVENIDYSAFEDCSMLGDGVVIVDGWVLTLNGACPEHLALPAGVKGIAARVFQGQTSLQYVEIPDSMQYICSCAFAGCTGLGEGLVIADGWVLGYNGNCPENLNIPQGIKAIAGGRDMWTNLKTLTIPEGVVSIGHEAFKSCTNLETVIFPVGLEKIHREAFEYCNLKNIVLPNSMMIYVEAFAGNEALQSVKFSGNPPTASHGNTLRGVFRRYRAQHETFGYYPKSSTAWATFLSTEDCQQWGFTMVSYDDGGSYDPNQCTTLSFTPQGWETPLGVSNDWIIAKGLAKEGDAVTDVETRLTANGKNGIPRYQSYILNMDPDSDMPAEEQLKVTIDGVDANGAPIINYKPTPNDASHVTVKKLGRKTLPTTGDTNWSIVNGDEADYKFFKVSVEVE